VARNIFLRVWRMIAQNSRQMFGHIEIGKYWRPVRDSNSRYRRESEATYCNSKELSGMDTTLPNLKDSRERLLDV